MEAARWQAGIGTLRGFGRTRGESAQRVAVLPGKLRRACVGRGTGHASYNGGFAIRTVRERRASGERPRALLAEGAVLRFVRHRRAAAPGRPQYDRGAGASFRRVELLLLARTRRADRRDRSRWPHACGDGCRMADGAAGRTAFQFPSDGLPAGIRGSHRRARAGGRLGPSGVRRRRLGASPIDRTSRHGALDLARSARYSFFDGRKAVSRLDPVA